MPATAKPVPETDEKKSRGLGSYVVWAFVAVMVYVLSSGPVMSWAYYKELTSKATNIIGIIYFPLAWAYESPLLHKPLGLYWHMWCPEYIDKNGDR
jgi:hypothetical protein